MSSKTPATGDARPANDWEAIEREYRAGQLSEAEIARKFSISRTAIQKKAKKLGWSRDLTDKVNKEIAARLVAEGLQVARGAATIDQAATRGVGLILSHRQDIAAGRGAVTRLIQELHGTMDSLDEIEDAILEDTEAKDGDAESPAERSERLKRRARMLAAIALPSRAQVANTLASALKALIPLERQAFNIDGAGNKPQDTETPITPTMSAQEAADAYAATLRLTGPSDDTNADR